MRRLILWCLIIVFMLVPQLASAKAGRPDESIQADVPYLASAIAGVMATCPATITLPSGSTVTCREQLSRVYTPQAQVWRRVERTVDYRNALGMVIITHTAIQNWLEDSVTGEILHLAEVEQHFWSFLYRLMDSGRSQTVAGDGRHFISTSWGRFGICIGDYCANTIQTSITLTR